MFSQEHLQGHQGGLEVLLPVLLLLLLRHAQTDQQGSSERGPDQTTRRPT